MNSILYFSFFFKMILRSSKHPKNFQFLPSREKIIYISCSELYHSLHNDYFVYIMEEKMQEDLALQKKKWEEITEKSVKTRNASREYFYVISQLLMDDQKCKFMGDCIFNSTQFVKEKPLFATHIRFRNPRSHVMGTIDCLFHTSLFSQLYENSDVPENKYIMCFFLSGYPTLYYQHKMTSLYHYFYKFMPDMLVKERVLLLDTFDSKKYEWFDICPNRIQKIKGSIRWIRKSKKFAKHIDVYHNKRYFPNMKIKSSVWMPFKKEVCKRVGDITQLWCCDDRHRQMAFQHGVFSWKSERFTPELIGFQDEKKIHILRMILSINRQDPSQSNFQWIRIEDRLLDKWPLLREGNYHQDFYFDFEYTQEFVYQIGIFGPDGYQCFWAHELNEIGEKQLLQRFVQFCREHTNVRFWYWHAEKDKFIRTMRKHDMLDYQEVTRHWIDMAHLMRTGTIVLYGAFDFSLKSIVNACYQLQKIPFSYDELECADGSDSLKVCEKYYKNKDGNEKLILEKYNRMDCEAMKFILHHIYSNLSF